MGMDMTLYHESDKDIWTTEEVDSSRCPYYRNERELHDLLSYHGKKISESEWELDRSALTNVLISILPSIMNIYAGAVDAQNEMTNVINQELSRLEDIHQEYYVIGRMLDRVFKKEYKDDYHRNALTLLNDEDGTRMKNFVINMCNLIKRTNNNEKVIYNCSY